MGGSLCVIKQKSPDFSVETTWFLKSTIMKRWFPPFGFHAHSFMQVSSAISFRLPSASISAAASPDSPLSSAFASYLSGLPLSRPVAASASLSDLRCFRSLSVASVLDSDYSASVSSFPSLPDSASQWLPQCSALTFVPAVFPVLPCLVSRAFFPGSGTQPRCMFPFTLP